MFFPGGEPRKRLAEVETLAEQMVARGGDRASIIVAFGGGILTDVAGFLAAIFMRGIPVIQVPTTLLAQVDAAVGGKTGVNLASGKNLIGSFHQPLAVIIDPAVLDTLPEREYRAGLFEIVKHGVIADADLFWLMSREPQRVLSHAPEVVDRMICDSVRIKAEVVSGDEKEQDRRRILNFGHTFGHALEAETGYSQFLHGEAVAWGMKAATLLGEMERVLSAEDKREILRCVNSYGPLPPLAGVDPARLAARLKSDKKTVQGQDPFRPAGAHRRGEDHLRRSGAIRYRGHRGSARLLARGHHARRRRNRAASLGLGARHVRPHRAALRPAESFAVDEYRPLLARAHGFSAWRTILARPGAQVLDVCCGTGDLTLAL